MVLINLRSCGIVNAYLANPRCKRGLETTSVYNANEEMVT